jgi:hypothetical protein
VALNTVFVLTLFGFEQSLLSAFFNTLTLINDSNIVSIALIFRGLSITHDNADLILGSREFNCILDQINQYLLDSEFVTHDVPYQIDIVLLFDLDLEWLKLHPEKLDNRCHYILLETHHGQIRSEHILVHQVAVKIALNLAKEKWAAVNNGVEKASLVLYTRLNSLCKHYYAPQGCKHFVWHCLAHHCQHLVVLVKPFIPLQLADVSKRDHPALFVLEIQLLDADLNIDFNLPFIQTQ